MNAKPIVLILFATLAAGGVSAVCVPAAQAAPKPVEILEGAALGWCFKLLFGEPLQSTKVDPTQQGWTDLAESRPDVASRRHDETGAVVEINRDGSACSVTLSGPDAERGGQRVTDAVRKLGGQGPMGGDGDRGQAFLFMPRQQPNRTPFVTIFIDKTKEPATVRVTTSVNSPR